MRKLSIIGATVLLAACAYAGPQMHVLPAVTLGTNDNGTASISLSGYVEAVYVKVASGSSTGTVAVSYVPHLSGTAVNIATGSAEQQKVWRPRVDSTAVDGTGLTSDPPVRFALAGETVTFAVSSASATGVVWNCVIVMDE